ncbi:MAG: DUF2934 domain-containing protein [Nitrospirota bacterium]|nr:DUF2934 domain-containing protein [Nitrospirota bacterium]
MPAQSSKVIPKSSLSKDVQKEKNQPEKLSHLPTPSRSRKKSPSEIPDEERRQKISETAYFIAERRGFTNGNCDADWFEAERVVMQHLN